MHKIMLFDDRLRGKTAGGWLIEPYLDRFESRFGALDGAILWHAYPNLGLDCRNQFDFWRLMPGGLAGLRDLVRRLHVRDVRVILAYHPWDRATRREDVDDSAALAELVGELDADGIFLDTLSSGLPGLRAALDAVKPGVVLQSQASTPLDRLAGHRMGWAEVWRDSRAPGVLRNRYHDRRHMVHVVRRWQTDHGPEIQLAWMNGAGMMVWENVFGSWNGWSDRDAAQWRHASAIRRRWFRHFAQGAWTPLAAAPAPGVYASCWEHGGVRLWTLVNRTARARRGLRLPVSAGCACDLMAGARLDVAGRGVTIGLPARGLGAVIETDVPDAFLEGQAELARRRDRASGRRPLARIRRLPAARPAAARDVPEGMVAVPGGEIRRRVRYRVRECGMYEGASAPGCDDLVLPGLHTHREELIRETLAAFAIDRTSVTLDQYRRFVTRTGYRPAAPEGFDLSTGRPGDPVCRVDLDDARAYASWLGRRLPTEAEWQKAADDGLLGDDAVNVWNWTEPEMSDGRTRFCMVKGGCDGAPGGSDWYADGGRKDAEFSAKVLLLWPGLDRTATIGFRTAVDLG